MNRRQFLENGSKGSIGIALLTAEASAAGFLLSGCAITLADVITWTNIGAGAIQAALTVLSIAGVVCAVCAVAAPIAQAAIHAIASAIQEWQAADPTQKATLWEKVKLAMQVAIDQAKAFFAGITGTTGAAATAIIGIASLIINTILGFIQQFFPQLSTAAMAAKYSVGATPITVAPKSLSAKAFKSQINALLKANGFATVVLS